MEDSGSRLPTRQDFPHLTDAHWAKLEKMVSLLEEAPFAGFPNLSAEQRKARVERIDKSTSSLIAHVSAAAQEAARAAMRGEALGTAQASITTSAPSKTRSSMTKPVKISVPTFDGKDSDNLVFWVRETEIALSAGQIYDARAKVAFALSNLGGRARAWAMACETANPGYFTSWSFMEQELRSTFLHANVSYRHHSNFLRCKQGKRSLQDYVMELHNLEAAMAGAPLSEDVKVTVFMDGVRMGPVSSSPASPKEQVPGTTLLCLSVTASRSNLVVVTASVKGYPEPMTVLIDSGVSFNFATKASVAQNNALYASALEASKSNTNVSVRLPTGSIVSTRKVTIPLSVKFNDFNLVEPFIGVDMDDRYDLILGMPWLAKHEPWIDWRSRTIGASHNPLADRALAGHFPSSSRDEFVHEHRVPRDERQVAGSSEVLELPTAVPVIASTSVRDRVLDVFTGEPKVWEVLTPLPTVAELLELEELSYVEFLDSLKAGELAELVLLRPEGGALELNSSSVVDPEVLEDERTSKRQTRYGAAILKDPSDPYHPLLKAFSDVVSDDPPSILPPDRGVRHEIDLAPGTKYCTTRQWPLPKERVDVIDAFFAAKHAAGMVRESKSPHSSPTFCVRKPNGKWRMVHAFNKLNAATVPSTPIPRNDVLQNNMAGCAVFNALEMADGYYQLLVRESDNPLTAVRTPSEMLWEWLVMPQGLSNAPATFNRLVTQLFRPMRHLVQTYFDDIFVHSRASEGKTAVEAHLGRLREMLLCMRENHLYANINKCIFGTEEIPFLGCFLGKDGVRADPEKVCAIGQWSVPVSQKDLHKWHGLANYLHKYSTNYANMARPLTNLLKKDAVWSWTSEAQQAFEAIKSSPQSAPILALPDEDRPFSVVCDASDFAIGCDLIQVGAEDREMVVSFQSFKLKAAEKNYLVLDKELLAMKYAMVKFRVHLLGQKPFVIYTDHASLRTATSSPHLSQRMARWLPFFAEYNSRWITVEYKPGKQNVLADALSRRPDNELAHLAYHKSPLYESFAGPLTSAPLLSSGGFALLPMDNVFRHHGLPEAFVSDRDPRFVSHFWQYLFRLLGTRLDMSTADHPQTDGQTERVNRVLEDTLRSVCAAEPTKWSTLLPQVEFALFSAVHSSTGFTPFYANGPRHPRTPLTLPPASNLGGGEANAEAPRGLKSLITSFKRNWLSFIATGETVQQRVRDAMAAAQDRQKENSDRHGRANTQVFQVGDQVLLNAKNLPIAAVSEVDSTTLRPRFIGPFTGIGVHGHAYTLDLPSAMATHPTFYVGLLKPYRLAAAIDPSGSAPPSIAEGHSPSLAAAPPSQEPGLGRIAQQDPRGGARRGPPRSRPASRASESSRDARIRSAAHPRRSPRIATAGNSPDPVHDQGDPPAQASPAQGAAGDASPRELRDQPQRGARQSADDPAASPSPPAGYPEVADSFPRPITGHPTVEA
ncbi:unnamed protein product [Phytophthora fragariaefolia]|uniref:RNA-directed DNA polymerase n=1 Tax=Phytophthora fragariaefolia TaxID=1490495 RepID=A0A9W6XH90_9STRA|nr:unnamed protein product [Phytophthora fragariaefolia]